MKLINRIKQAVAKGISVQLGSYVLSFRIARCRTNMNEIEEERRNGFFLRQAIFLKNKYPVLRKMDLQLSTGNAKEILDCFIEIIPALDPAAREVCIRNALYRLRSNTNSNQLKLLATMEIARSDLRSGIPDRARELSKDANLRSELMEQIRRSDEAYGAQLLSQAWGSNMSRGQCLIYYFASHQHLIRGKRVLHISPEAELREWMQGRASELEMYYTTSNIFGKDVDTNQDLTAMNLDGTFDVVICHRVLEHVLDDAVAFKELYRSITPGGHLQISVPQSMHQDNTEDWTIPDLTHHEHVRQYGRDFVARLAYAGFAVEEVPWFLQKSREELLSNDAYPLRIYMASKA